MPVEYYGTHTVSVKGTHVLPGQMVTVSWNSPVSCDTETYTWNVWFSSLRTEVVNVGRSEFVLKIREYWTKVWTFTLIASGH